MPFPKRNSYYYPSTNKIRLFNARKRFFAGEPGLFRKKYLGLKRFQKVRGGMHPFTFSKTYKKWKR